MCIRDRLTALPLAAQTPQSPQSRLQRGFASLSQGTWGHALAEWNQDGMLSEERLEAARAALEQLAPQPRTIGEWGPIQPPLVQRLWQRHWAMATFERTAVFLALDFVVWGQHVAFHRIPWLWRLHRMHHADLDYDVTTALRFHPLEIALSMLEAEQAAGVETAAGGDRTEAA